MDFNNGNELAKIIDHSLLKPDATLEEIEKICQEAVEYKFHSVCVNSWWVKRAKELLRHSVIKLCTVLGFPLGMTTSKFQEAINVTLLGVDEFDMVIAIGALKSKLYTEVFEDIKKIVDLDYPVKVILETCLLTKDEILKGCELSVKAGAQFVKTSTGFSTSGADAKIIKLIKDNFGNDIKIKASGGINTLDILKTMVDAGASRIGTSNAVKILNEFPGS